MKENNWLNIDLKLLFVDQRTEEGIVLDQRWDIGKFVTHRSDYFCCCCCYCCCCCCCCCCCFFFCVLVHHDYELIVIFLIFLYFINSRVQLAPKHFDNSSVRLSTPNTTLFILQVYNNYCRYRCLAVDSHRYHFKERNGSKKNSYHRNITWLVITFCIMSWLILEL